ncbi:MAG: DnaJ domain-containing protein [Okeania sp. SIO3I5]|uniref:J domain-containing protein n=1 Tax=Okeania sp. SIO3I5 TaxID=2607805 RepID=UPI0013B8AB5A|nr:J domain-containing protein [Okeania sp. SIO3I5]NEQ38058.1 DnaJ domain-containing protein [Okeania sp. SIO3I5]
MNIADYYRKLELNLGASLGEVKASYRRLARMYHPDVNPKDRQAKDKFIAVTEAYKILLRVAPTQTELAYNSTPTSTTNKKSKSETVSSQTTAPKQTKVRVTPKQKQDKNQFHTSEIEKQLKQNYYLQLKQLLKYKRYPRAVAIVEGLAQRMPQDWEVRQWQAIAYQRWARHLISERKLDKARNYLKKALKTDPQNRALSAEVEHDFRQLEKIY